MHRSQSRKLLNGIIWNTQASGPSDIVKNLPADLDDWNCGHWITYKNLLIASEGLNNAKIILLNDMENTSIWSSLNNSCHYDCDFVREMEALGPEFNFSIFTDVFCAGHKAVESTADTVANVATGVGKTANILAMALPIILIGGAYYAIKNPKKVKMLLK